MLVFFSVLGTIYTIAYQRIENGAEELLNSNPERTYNINFKDVELGPFFKSMRLYEVEIRPRVDDLPTLITCDVNYAEIEGIVWWQLLLNRALDIEGLQLINPQILLEFRPDSLQVRRDPAKVVQSFFGDILSRGKLSHFALYQGSIHAREQGAEKDFFTLEGMTVSASDLRTDELQFQYLVPFSMTDFQLSTDYIYYQPNDIQVIEAGAISYTHKPSEMHVSRFSMSYNLEWKELSDYIDEQKDLINLDIEEIKLKEISIRDAASGDWSISANSGRIEHVGLTDYRDKNKVLTNEDEKPFFQGMINKLPIPIDLDTLQLADLDIKYMEVAEKKDEPGVLTFNDMYVSVYRLTNVPEMQRNYGTCEIDLITRINGAGKSTGKVTFPYLQPGQFQFQINMDTMDLEVLNPTIMPIANVRIHSGKLLKLDFTMEVSEGSSNNYLDMHYKNLSLDLLKKEEQKKDLVSILVNTLIKRDNRPSDKNYRDATYISERVVSRGPFNFMWKSLKEGMARVVPTKMARRKMKKAQKRQEEKSKLGVD